MRTFLGIVIAVLVLATAVLFSLSMMPQPAEEIPPDAVRVNSNGTVLVVLPWAVSLATTWWAEPVSGLNISRGAMIEKISPAYQKVVGVRTYTISADRPGTYTFAAWRIPSVGEEHTISGRAPDYSRTMVFTDGAENSAAIAALWDGEQYTLTTDRELPQGFLPLRTNGAVQIVLPWYSSLGMAWSMEATDGLNITETRHVNPLPPYGKHQGKYVYTITANDPGIYLFHAKYILYGKDAPFAEYSVILLVSDTAGVREITVEYLDEGEYLLTSELLDITFQETLVLPSAPSVPSSRTATPTPAAGLSR